MPANTKNIRPAETHLVMWDAADPAKSLEDMRTAVEGEAQSCIDWYWREKRWKRIPSQWIQFLALFLTASAGITPIALQLVKNAGIATTFDSGPLASLLVGVAASLLGLDKAFGYSSGWTRYVLTATSMTKLLHDFRLDWVALSAAASTPPATGQQTAMIQRAKEFMSTIQGMVMQETKDWATEFQSTMAQMEKDLKTQLDTLKAQVDQTAKEREAAATPGSIELTVTNADKTDGFRLDVVAEGQSGKLVDSVSNAKVWTRINMAPGQYRVGVDAQAGGRPAATSTIVDIKPGEIAKASVTLPIA